MGEMQIAIIMLPGVFVAVLVFLWVFTDELARRQRRNAAAEQKH